MRQYLWAGIAAIILLALIFGSTIVRLYTDWIWFQNLGFTSIFSRTLVTKTLLFLITTLVFFGIVYLNLRLARRIAPLSADRFMYMDELRQRFGAYTQRALGLLLTLGALGVAVLVGLAATAQWDEVLRFIYAVPFGDRDPIFNRDIGFYVFQLPFLRFIYSQLFFAIFVSLIAVAAFYYMGQAIEFLANTPRFAPKVKTHVFALIALLFLIRAAGYWLDRYNLLSIQGPLIPGPAYADVHGRLPAYYILAGLSVVAAILTLLNIPRRGIGFVTVGFVGLIVASIALGMVYPGVLQRFVVKPDEFGKERPYISHAINFTLKGYGLTNVDRRTYEVTNELSAQNIVDNQATIRNVRLWDYEPLLRTYSQTQELQPYYKFNEVDIDRYTINGNYRQVMLSVRELQQEGLQEQAQTWVNQHLVYTHGYGVTMSPVNEVSREGLPRFFMQDIPPVSNVDLEVGNPAIYFGELTQSYSLVNTDQQEFDYPQETANVFTQYRPNRGVRISNFLNRVLFAIRLADLNLMITTNVTPQSRLLFRRALDQRIPALFPFLQFDRDPYPVLSDGRVHWIQDAYTTSDRFPYAWQQGNLQFNYATWPTRLNYIRNSVKITVDAYTGDVRAYVSDENDPIIRTYSRAFPGVFRPISQMTADLRSHVRYPEDLFSIQTLTYNTYHMTDPQVFYNKGDLWETPRWRASASGDGTTERSMEPYYVIMRLPGEEDEEFILLRPFTRANRNNMVAWVCARSDGPNYGNLVVFEFEKGQLVYGPAQIEARANQDANISQQITLWGQSGSNVIWGNLLAIPIENSLLYVQPLYLESTATNIPEFRRVIVAVGDRLTMEENLETAIAKVVGAPAPQRPAETARPQPEAQPEARPAAPPTAAPAPRPAPTSPGDETQSLVDQAAEQLRRAQDAQRRGDWAAYGTEMRRLEQTITELQGRTGEAQ